MVGPRVSADARTRTDARLDPGEAEPQILPLRAKGQTPLQILVVDDEPLVRWSCAETLADNGFQAIEAASGAGAVFALAKPGGGADLVLLDLMLPDFCDLSLLAVIRRLAPRVPIILMTAHATPEIVERAQRFGVYKVIDKPFEMDVLAPLIHEALRAASLG
jgi:two-component system nitrogen regulation response regulator GlnG